MPIIGVNEWCEKTEKDKKSRITYNKMGEIGLGAKGHYVTRGKSERTEDAMCWTLDIYRKREGWERRVKSESRVSCNSLVYGHGERMKSSHRDGILFSWKRRKKEGKGEGESGIRRKQRAAMWRNSLESLLRGNCRPEQKGWLMERKIGTIRLG